MPRFFRVFTVPSSSSGHHNSKQLLCLQSSTGGTMHKHFVPSVCSSKRSVVYLTAARIDFICRRHLASMNLHFKAMDGMSVLLPIQNTKDKHIGQ